MKSDFIPYLNFIHMKLNDVIGCIFIVAITMSTIVVVVVNPRNLLCYNSKKGVN